VNNRKLLDGVLEAIGLGGEANAGKRLTVLRAIDKLDRLGPSGVRALLGDGRKDESGDFTKGAGLSSDAIEKVLGFTEGKPIEDSVTAMQGRAELDQMAALFSASAYGDRIKIDPSVVRGLEYYTGPVYEVELTFPIEGDEGKPVRFGSVAGGGRYDGLVARFRGEPVPATGFSIGVSRLAAALTHLGKIDTRPEPGPVVVTVFPDVPIAEYQRLVAQLRDAEYAPGKKIRAELYLGSGKFGAQMKYADKRGSPCVVIQGGNEKEKGEVQIKDLILGAEIAGLSKDRDDYLKKQAEAQFAVRESELVDAVKKVLARNSVTWG
jgi:histidyl-tRNA synthetase